MAVTLRINTYNDAALGFASADCWSYKESVLDTWITAVNGNASNVGRQITKLKGYASTTAPSTIRGWVIQLDHPTLDSNVFEYRSYSITSMYSRGCRLADYTNDTSNSGYGTLSNTLASLSMNSVTSTNVNCEQVVCYDDADGVEFYFTGWRNGNTGSTGWFMIFKTTQGEWFVNGAADSYVQSSPGFSWTTTDNAAFEKSPTFTVMTYTSTALGVLSPSLVYNSLIDGDNRFVNKLAVKAANTKLYSTNTHQPFLTFTSQSGAEVLTLGNFHAIDSTGL